MSVVDILQARAGATAQGEQDLGPLAWVLDELRKSLESAAKAVSRYVRDADSARNSDLEDLDTSALRIARQQLHQAGGALEMVGMNAPALLLRGMEGAVHRFVQQPELCTHDAANTLERAGFALVEYLETLLAGKSVSAVALFTQYQQTQSLAGNEKAHPADLWPAERRAREPAWVVRTEPLAYGPEARALLDGVVLRLIKSDDREAAAQMRDLCLRFAQGLPDDGVARCFWKVAAAFFEGLADSLIIPDVYVKRMASRVLMQYASMAKGDVEPPSRLLQDLLFFCAQAHPRETAGPVLKAVQQAYSMQSMPLVDYHVVRFGRFDPAVLQQARKRITTAADSWSAVAGGEKNKIKLVPEQFGLVAESLVKLHPSSHGLARALIKVAESVNHSGEPPQAELAMEVATAVLYLQAMFATADLDQVQIAPHLTSLVARLESSLQGAPAQPLETWMEDLYRQASDHQTMGSVVSELHNGMGSVESELDKFFRDPQNAAGLAPVADKMAQMRGVLSVLGMDQAALAMQRMRDNIERLVLGQVAPVDQQALFLKLGNSMGAMGFLVDMLSYQRDMARKLFVYDAEIDELRIVMGRKSEQTEPVPASAAPAPAEIEVSPETSYDAIAATIPAELNDFAATNLMAEEDQRDDYEATEMVPFESTEIAGFLATEPAGLDMGDFHPPEHEAEPLDPFIDFLTSSEPVAQPVELVPEPAPEPVAAPAPVAVVAPAFELAEDDSDEELLGIFIEEAKEVVTTGLEALNGLDEDPANLSEQTTLRRAFHTLKGSSRMVGLGEFGEAGWAMEQMLNAWLAEQRPMPDGMRSLARDALKAFGQWAEAIEKHDAGAWESTPFRAAADAMRLQGEYEAASLVPRPARRISSDADAPIDFPVMEQVHEEAAAEELQEAVASEDFPTMTEVVEEAAHDERETEPVQQELSELTFEEFTAVAEDSKDEQSITLETQSEPLPDDLVTVHEISLDDVPELQAAWPVSVEFTPVPAASTPPADAPAEVEPLAETMQELDFSAFEAALRASESDVEPLVVVAETPVETPVTPEVAAEPLQALNELEVKEAAAVEATPVFEALELKTDEAVETTETVESAAEVAESDFDENIKVVDGLQISLPLYNVYLNEADDRSLKLDQELQAWLKEPQRPVPDDAIAYAHSLAGSSATVGFQVLSDLARLLEHTLQHLQHQSHGDLEQIQTCLNGADEIRRLLHQFAAGFIKAPQASVMEGLKALLDLEISQSDTFDTGPDSLLPDVDTAWPPLGVTPAQTAQLQEISFAELEEHSEPEKSEEAPEQTAAEAQAEAAEPISLEALPPKALAETPVEPATPAPTAEVKSEPEIKPELEVQSEPEAKAETPVVEPEPVAVAVAVAAVNAAMESVEPVAEVPVVPVAEEAAAPEVTAPVPETKAEAPVEAKTESKPESTPEPVAEPEVAPAVVASAAAPVSYSSTSRTVNAQQEAELQRRIDEAIAHAMAMGSEISTDIEAVDDVDLDLFPIFEEEAIDLFPKLGAALRRWHGRPGLDEARNEVLRALHTLKGSARLAGAMRLGEMAHRLESAVERVDTENGSAERIEPLLNYFDELQADFDALRAADEQAAEEPLDPLEAPLHMQSAGAQSDSSLQPITSMQRASAEPAAKTAEGDDAQAKRTVEIPLPVAPVARPGSQQTVRVRAQLLDRLISQAGEVLIARSRVDARLSQARVSLQELAGNLERLRMQLRDIEVQAESQMQSRLALSKDTATGFDPLEFDRFTRVQELTRMMAESVNDVATVQRNLQRDMAGAEDDLVAQGRQAREMQRDLLRTRMVEFDSLAERLYAVVRQTSKELGKQVRLNILGGTIEMDRGMLDRMMPAFEHLLRNCVAHGIELPAQRQALGKPLVGTIEIILSQERNDVSLTVEDDGAGLNVERIREKAMSLGLWPVDKALDVEEAGRLIFEPGFSTVTKVTGVAGRGIGMDVVRSEVNSLGGRIETHSEAGRGSAFRLIVPLTTAVTQVVMLRAGQMTIGVPANLVEIVRRTPLDALEAAYREHELHDSGEVLPLFWAGSLLQSSMHSEESVGRTRPVVILRSASQRIALHVDEVLGNQEVVIKNLGPQLSRLPGLTGMSVLPSGAVVQIYNPVALANVYGDEVRARMTEAQKALAQSHINGVSLASGPVSVPLVLVVDDSITVRRVTQRLLQREGYRVALAADGLQAIEQLHEERPTVVLSDIEMPRMDGFDLLRNIRADESLQDLPVIMITSRIAQKHREMAKQLGANHYLGKPYSDEELLGLIQDYVLQASQPGMAGAVGLMRESNLAK